MKPSGEELAQWYSMADEANLKLKANSYVSAEMFDELMALLQAYRSGSAAQ